jgi:phosphatidate cytidylyltransferase
MSGGTEQARPVRSNLRQRVISAVVLAVIVLTLTWAGGVWFRLLSVAIGAAIFYEWATMAGAVASTRHQIAGWLLAAVALIALALGIDAWLLLSAALGGSVLLWIHARIAGEGGWLWLALPYATIPAAALALLRGADTAGIWAMLFLFAVVWATDIFAFFVGRAVGGPKLAPSISPGKTWSGAIGGTVCGVIAGAAVAWFAAPPVGIAPMALIALAMSVIGQAGDLFESGVKRRFGVKDSSALIPGHGGVMDRVDALVVAAAALYVVGALAGSADMPAQGLFG